MNDLLVKETGDFNPRLYNNVGAITGCTGVQSGGKQSRRKQSRHKLSRRKMKGGRNGYGFSFQASPIGNVGHAQNLMDWETYDGKTISSDTNLGAYSITGGKRKRKQSKRKRKQSKRKRKQTKRKQSKRKQSRRKQSRRKQSKRKRCGCKRKQSRRKQRGGFTLGSNGSYYGYAGTQGEDLGLFSGSGYPPMSSGSTNECINSPHTDGGASPITSSVSS